MSEFSELIKRFNKIRDYMRDFYVYGFKTREDYGKKSQRSYDNEKRRIESYLAEYMSFRLDENGKSILLSVDCADIPANPLYRAFKAKSFTKNDITLNFIILDILYGGMALSVSEITEQIAADYLACFEEPVLLDLSTVRNKLTEYTGLGILTTEKQGKKLLYSQAKSRCDPGLICDALQFFSEVSPLGVVGSYLLDKFPTENDIFTYKHHYIMHALESEIVYELLEAIHNRQSVEIVNLGRRSTAPIKVVPLKILISVQGGRRYLAAYRPSSKAIFNYRLDYIQSVRTIMKYEQFDEHICKLETLLEHTWGASLYKCRNLERLSMTLHIPHHERYIINRIEREGRSGCLTKLNPTTYCYSIEVYDTMEMLPWIRTFIGRIISLECDNKAVVGTFYDDLNQMADLYGGDGDVIL